MQLEEVKTRISEEKVRISPPGDTPNSVPNKLKGKTNQYGVDWSNQGTQTIQIQEFELNRLMHRLDSGGEYLDKIDISIPFISDESKEYLEENINTKLNNILRDELKKFCFICESRKMHDDSKDEYYCPVCNT